MELENISPSDLVILEIIIQWVLKFSQFLIFFGFFFFFPISQSGFSIIILKGLWVGKWIICEFKWIFIKIQIKLGLWLYFQAVKSKHQDAGNLSLSDTHSHLMLTYFFKFHLCMEFSLPPSPHQQATWKQWKKPLRILQAKNVRLLQMSTWYSIGLC